MRISRRTFLLSGTVAIAGASTYYFNARQSRIQKTIVAVFHKRLSQLAWTHDDVMQFTQDFMQHPRNRAYLQKINTLSYFYPVYAYSAVLEMSFLAKKIRNFEETICTRFLLSTDFFYHNNPNQIKYLAYYDPHKRPCSNPLS
ncbi:hypothetical protein [Candidatus Albibeggiatoa sp. nov. NOAA]|uniref:hypothetical protein n=1 Tax=Candidatus Albibeggiatoa sp. nov. NOAA TaxID=3162724 RepID=UPI0032F667B2|nr:hypothetical protein [Thiotrichaceae bacterium]